MTYPPHPGGYGQPDPHSQQPAYGQQPHYGPQSGPPADPVTGVPGAPAPYGQPTSGGQPPYGPPPYGHHGYPAPQLPPAAGERPGKVTAGVFCMLAIAVLWVIMSVAGIIGNNMVTDSITELCDGDAECLAQAEDATGAVWSNVIGFVLLVAFLATAIFTLQGHNWARIVSFVANGLSIAGNCCVSATTTVGLVIISAADQELQQQGAEQSISDFLPAWLLPVTITAAVITLILNIMAIILLANKESGQWFKAKDAERSRAG